MKYLLFLLLLPSCVSIQKAERKLDSKPVESAAYCMTRFPLKDSIITKDSILFDTLYVQGDSILVPITDTISIIKTVKVICPATQIITKTVLHDTTIYRDNSATQSRIKYLEQSTAVKDATIGRLTGGRNTWRWIALASDLFLLLIIGLLIYGNVKKL